MPTKKEKQPLSATHPEFAKEADGWDPSTITFGSSKRLTWKCNVGHQFVTSVVKRTRRGDGCPFCSGKKVLTGFNDLQTTHPGVALEALGWDPSKFTAGSNAQKLWSCSLKHSYTTSIVKRISRNNGCPYCSGHQVWFGFNDLATTHPQISSEAIDGPVTNYSAGSQQKLFWRCNLGHIYPARIAKRVVGTNCVYCAKTGNKDILLGFNDFATTHPQLASQAFGWDPKRRTMGQSVKLKWKCENEHIWKAKITKRVQGQGCPSCSVSGYDPNKKGYLYLLQHDLWQLMKIGITNSKNDRTGKHRKTGWEILEVRGPMDGSLAYQWEQSILRTLKINGAKLGASDVAGKFDGYSETWAISSFPARTLKELMEAAKSDEES